MLDIGLNKVDTSTLQSKGWAPTLPSTSGERFSLEFDAFRLGALSNSEEMGRYDAYEKITKRVRDATGEDIINPMALSPVKIDKKHFNVVGAGQPSRNEQLQTLSEAITRAQESDPSIPQIGDIEQGVLDKAKNAREAAFRAGEVSSPWTGPAAFAGMITGAMTDPVNLATLPLGAPARLAGSVAMRTLQAMTIEGGIAATTQAGIEIATQDFKKAAGIEDSSLANILAAGIGGGVLAGGLRGIVEAVASRAAGKLGFTLDQMDALAVSNRYAGDVSSAPKGIDTEVHLTALDEAINAVARMEPISPSGQFSLLARPGRAADVYSPQIEILKMRDDWLSTNLSHLPPEQPSTRAELLARVDAVEAQLRNTELPPDQRRALSNRRDELLSDVLPETLRAEAKISKERTAINNERAAIEKEINRLATERAFDTGWEPGPIARGKHTVAAARKEVIRVKESDPVIIAEGALGEARRVAADADPVIYSSTGQPRKASTLLEEAAEEKRVANEIADACLLAGATKI